MAYEYGEINWLVMREYVSILQPNDIITYYNTTSSSKSGNVLHNHVMSLPRRSYEIPTDIRH